MSMSTTNVPTLEEADGLFQAQQWAEAADAYAARVEAEPGNGRAWYRLGMARLALDDGPGAIVALKECVTIGRNPFAMFNLACAYARQHEVDQAIAWLTSAVQSGFRQVSQLDEQPDLARVRHDPRFVTVRAEAERRAKPGLFEAEYHQFDFWLGEWEVTSQGQFVGTNIIQSFSDGCGLLENYTQFDGYSGKSINYYDAVLGQWRQTWADSAGHMSEYIGNFSDGAMRFEGHWHRKDGSQPIVKLTFFHLDANHVRQYSEQSTDGGQTWQVAFDLLYTRRA